MLIRTLRAAVRGGLSLLMFAVFGIGALLLAPIVLCLRRPELSQPVIRASWRLVIVLFEATRLFRFDCDDMRGTRGAVIAATHPSLIDVVVLVARIPRVLYVAKSGLRANPFLSLVVRATALPDDATLPERAAPYLAKGWNVLIFPEGTRSPAAGGLHPFRRGAAQLALRTGAPVVCVRMAVSRRVLGKHQSPWDLGTETVTYSIRATTIPVQRTEGRCPHAAAVDLTDKMRRILL